MTPPNDSGPGNVSGPRASVQAGTALADGHGLSPLTGPWEAAGAEPGTHPHGESLEGLSWFPARVPGTAAGALRDAGLWSPGQPFDFDGKDWWFRTSFDARPPEEDEELILQLEGIATVAEVYLNGELVLESESMFATHGLDIGARVETSNELAIRCLALRPLLEVRRRPRAHWRTRLVEQGNLRFYRTMLLGRAPGFAPGPAVVGPWRPVGLERRRGLTVEGLTIRTRLEGADGVLAVEARLRALDGPRPVGVEVQLGGPSGEHRVSLELTADPMAEGSETLASGEMRVPEVERWWPHTHGQPALHEVRLLIDRGRDGTTVVGGGRVGFRELAAGASPVHVVERDGLQLHVNGVAIFARGAVWTPADIVTMAPAPTKLRERLELVRDAGMNMVRIPGTAAYESAAFHDLCDELGILVWQDFMFANLDYPIGDPSFRDGVEREVEGVLQGISGRPSLAVLCGNSEVEQQVAMLGLDPALGRGELFGELLPALVSSRAEEIPYVPSAPCGGELPFRPGEGIANYYGVGSYRRGLDDARLADVRFAAECLAFSNVPDEGALEEVLPEAGWGGLTDAAWKAGIPRDAGAGWDFEDVRDHYLATSYGVDTGELRSVEPERYLELSRMITGELMGEVFGEWRRAGSPCGGALVLWLADLLPGAGWGVLDHRGHPKAAYHHLRRALAPVAVWTVDEGLGGVVAHVANDLGGPLDGELHVALYNEGEVLVGEARAEVALAAHGRGEWNLETVLGRFVDVGWAFRFGPPAQDVIVVSLTGASGLISQAVRFPARRPLRRESPEQLGLSAHARVVGAEELELELESRRLVYGVHVELPGFLAEDDWFTLVPGQRRRVGLIRRDPGGSAGAVGLSALNMRGRTRATLEA